MLEDNAKGAPAGGPPMVSFVAPSGTGKTTLLEGVIAELKGRGHRVGAVKHDAHRIELDTRGKDSWRLRDAGAESTLLMGRNQLAWFGSDEGGPSLERAASLFFDELDVILVEGFRSADLPVVVVSRPDHVDDKWEAPDPGRVLLTVTPDEVQRVADLIVDRFL
ncbi:MAG: molybdopterin-guanine dinucleotide biosynthesis protein B [Acidimicrobiales bacterium]